MTTTAFNRQGRKVRVSIPEKETTPMTAAEVKAAIREQQTYNIDFLNSLANRSGIQLMTINFWWNAIKY